MRKLVLMLLVFGSHAQAQLTVDQVMRDQKWIGISPSNVSWSWNSKTVFFNWNPDQKVADSTYAYSVNSKEPVKIGYNEVALLNAINNGSYNSNYTKLAYTYRGDIYLLDLKANNTMRVT